MTISMDGKGRATDNFCIERFWRSAKCESIYLNGYESITQLKEDVNDQNFTCNTRRALYHSVGFSILRKHYNQLIGIWSK